jgi:hypothetical protein
MHAHRHACRAPSSPSLHIFSVRFRSSSPAPPCCFWHATDEEKGPGESQRTCARLRSLPSTCSYGPAQFVPLRFLRVRMCRAAAGAEPRGGGATCLWKDMQITATRGRRVALPPAPTSSKPNFLECVHDRLSLTVNTQRHTRTK